MRLAIVTTSSYAQNQQLIELPVVASQADLLCQRLTEPDANYFVYALPAERGLAEQLEELFAHPPEPIEALLFYFAGYAVVSDERGPGLLLDGERLSVLSLRRVRRLISQSSASSLVILDTISAFDGQNSPGSVVESLNEVLMGGQGGVHVLAANRSEHDSVHGSWPFTSLLALVLDWHATGTPLSPRALFQAMRAEETLFAEVQAAELFEAQVDFQVLTSQAPAAPSLAPSEGPPEASADAEARGDRYLAAGDLMTALGEYGAVLDRLGLPPTDRHAALYVKVASALEQCERANDALAYYDAALEIDARLTAALQGAAELRSRAGDAEAALELLERWLQVDPNALRAAELAARLLTEQQRWKELAGLYEHVLERVSEAAVAVELALELARLYGEKLSDDERAQAALERAAELAPTDGRIRWPLVALAEKCGQFENSLAHLRVALRDGKADDDGYRSAARLFSRCDRADGAWNAACVLELLGEADINESLLAAAHRPDGLLPAKGCLSEELWKQRLLCPERDRFVDELFDALGTAAIDVGLEAARRKRRLMALDASTEFDPNLSTATAAKTLLWTARLLGVPVPRLHVVAALHTAFAAAPVQEPTLLMSKSLGSGLSLPELAFLWGRQLAFLRPEHRPIVLFPNVPELASLMLAALSLGGVAKLPFKKLEGDAKLFARSLKRHIEQAALERLAAVAREFPLRDTKAKMLGWARAVELAAGRAGLLASGDVELAARMTRRFPLGGLVETEEQVKDLLSYCLSVEYESLRESLGVLLRN